MGLRLEFIARPTGRTWYPAHNAGIVGGYLEHHGLAGAEGAPERFFMNVALARVLFTHAVVAAPRLALGRLGPLGRVLGDPRLGLAGVSCPCGGCFRIATRWGATSTPTSPTSSGWAGCWTTR